MLSTTYPKSKFLAVAVNWKERSMIALLFVIGTLCVGCRESKEEAASPLDRKPGEGKTIDLGKGIKLEMVWIPAGSFQMGSPDKEKGRGAPEGPVHKVTLSKGFWMGKYEVSQEQYQRLMGNNPSHRNGDRNPVEKVTWDDCQKFIEKLNGTVKGTKFRLPTEAEWEYACRAGTKTRYYTGNSESDLAEAGWYKANSQKKSYEVGQKKRNPWGLYDMHGNVYEWCSDRWPRRGREYPEGAQVDPQGPSKGSDRVFRGGGLGSQGRWCRSGFRNGGNPMLREFNLGFRVVAVQSK